MYLKFQAVCHPAFIQESEVRLRFNLIAVVQKIRVLLPVLRLSLLCITGARGGVMVKALRYKPAGRGFDSRWCHWKFSVT